MVNAVLFLRYCSPPFPASSPTTHLPPHPPPPCRRPLWPAVTPPSCLPRRQKKHVLQKEDRYGGGGRKKNKSARPIPYSLLPHCVRSVWEGAEMTKKIGRVRYNRKQMSEREREGGRKGVWVERMWGKKDGSDGSRGESEERARWQVGVVGGGLQGRVLLPATPPPPAAAPPATRTGFPALPCGATLQRPLDRAGADVKF